MQSKDAIFDGRKIELPTVYFTKKQMNNNRKITRDDFMAFFRDDEQLNTLSNDDRVEVFCTILAGSSDFTKELLNDVLGDYSVVNIEINEITNSSLINK